MKKIKKLENDTISKQLTLEQVTPCFQNYMTVKQGILKKQNQTNQNLFCIKFDLIFQICKKLGNVKNTEKKSVWLSKQ